MASSPFFDEIVDLPVVYYNRRKRPRSILASFCNSLEDQFDQEAGRLFRSLPAVLMTLESQEPPQKKKAIKKQSQDNAVVSTKDNLFQVRLDTSRFTPEDLSVKVVGDKICVSAKQETKSSDYYEYHVMQREFTIPESVDPDNVTSKLNKDGELTIEAPMKAIKEAAEGRTVSIQRVSSEESASESSQKSDSDNNEQSE